MEKITWTGRVKNEVLHYVKEERKTVHTIKLSKTNWIDHCLPKQVTEGNLDGNRGGKQRRERRRKHLLDDPKE
jgi:hypothetical protein